MNYILEFGPTYYKEHPIRAHLELAEYHFQIENEQLCVRDVSNENIATLSLFESVTLENIQYVYFSMNDENVYPIKEQTVLIGESLSSDIIMEGFQLAITTQTLVNHSKHKVYINGKELPEGQQEYRIGDRILLGLLLLIIKQGEFVITGDLTHYLTSLIPKVTSQAYFEGYPLYKRSPRVIQTLSDEKITIQKPIAKSRLEKGSLVKLILPPIIGVGATIAISVIMPRGPYIFVTLAMTLVTTVFSVVGFFSDRKKTKEENTKKEAVYYDYLLDTRKKLQKLQLAEKKYYDYHYPLSQEIIRMIETYNPRLYEKDSHEDDFLMIRVGNAAQKSDYHVSFDYNPLEVEKDHQLEEAKEVYQLFTTTNNKPVIVDLKQTHLGLVGEKQYIHAEMKDIITQITYFQSYHDVEIIMLHQEKYHQDFDYLKWYPHFKLHQMNVTGVINNEGVRDQVLASLQQILRDRKLKLEEHQREAKYLPHFILLVDDYHLLVNHPIMEYLQRKSVDLGITMIYCASKQADLPDNIKTVVQLEDTSTGRLLVHEGRACNQTLQLNHTDNSQLESTARILAALVHQQGIVSQIPEAITFFELYGVEHPEELHVNERWKKSQSHQSLAVPLGVRAKEDIVYLNLHEKAHGPHGLVAGTTGSGKSEIIQSYVLSLAVHFHPHEVGFLLIDYKGGGMANLFQKLPHLLGTITNLDGAESMRALASIKSELKRRQRIFNACGVNNIIQYTKLFKAGKVTEPLPTLFIISDEFAELKKEQPEFMSELVSIARIGRTLGIKLILATQKPTGVVDDQIWSNSKFKLALKVQDESDSKEVIKTADAAYITQPGRAYLQVGNNEIYELFQSAWSGASYTKEIEAKIDDRVYKMNILGQAELINQDLSEDKEAADLTTQLDVVVEHVSTTYESLQATAVKKPWLPSLEEKIISPYIQQEKMIDTATIHAIDLTCPIGLIDIPEEQKQADYTIDFMKDGNLFVFGSSGYGKTITLETIMNTLAVKNNPQLLQYYILDFGNSAMIPYKDLPHVADYMGFDDIEKLSKFITLMENEIKARKQLFGRSMVQNIAIYNQAHSDNLLKTIFVMVDNYDVIKELAIDLESALMRLSRDGSSVGIYIVVSASRVSGVKYATLNNFKNRIAQYMFDESEVSNAVGRGAYKLTDKIKGRALVKQNSVSMAQIYSSVPFEDDLSYLQHNQAFIGAMKEAYTGKPVKGIAVLPDIFTTQEYEAYELNDTHAIKLGLHTQAVTLVGMDTSSSSPFLILGPSSSGKTNVLEVILNQLGEQDTCTIFDSKELAFYKYKDKEQVTYIENEEQSKKQAVENLFEAVEARKEAMKKAMAQDSSINPKEFYQTLPKYYMIMDDVDYFVEQMQSIPNMVELLKDAVDTGIVIIGAGHSSKLKGADPVMKFFKTASAGLLVGNQGTHAIFDISSKETPAFGFGVLLHNNKYQKIKLPKYTETQVSKDA
ncbi:type VII secretion protein EssC [Listeria booriae]|uniref:type VII secretion protein EssC n=1 Tax=Listeria booriae TaxID=1552123 RepID=UPI00288024E4|nr:type VII secretion protein EssC [Listeria booriae]MDT0109678.1 type VII secretion protein EssC [Listeria booriae]